VKRSPLAREHPSKKLIGEAARRGVRLHRIHALGQASRLEIDDLGMVWRGEGGAGQLKVDVAHRFAVCWNVCEGVPTEELERGFWRDLTDAVEAGDLKAARAALARIDRGTDRTNGRLHDCASCGAE
jgi:hypothetical protein